MSEQITTKTTEPRSLAQFVGQALANPATREQIATGFAPWLDRDQFAGQCAIVAADPAMAGADWGSLLRALFKVGQWGLLPGPARHVSLIVAKDGSVQVRPEFRGWQYVWQIAGWEVTAHLVHFGDDFAIDNIGADEFTVAKHSYDPFGDRVLTDKTTRGGYVKGVSRVTGEVRYRFVPIAKILSNRAKAQTQAVWGAHFAEMAQKTLVHVAMSRGWFPTPAAIASGLAEMADADHEAAGVVLQRSGSATPVATRASQIAARIAASAAPAPASAPQTPQTTNDAPAAETRVVGQPDAPSDEADDVDDLPWNYAADKQADGGLL